MVLSYGFNQQEANRSFRHARKLDPNCAMAYWGSALVLGPNLNAGMSRNKGKEAFGLVKAAIRELDNETPREWALIMALEHRYTEEGRVRDAAYADAMRKVAEQFPKDSDVLTLTAEALMDVHKWNYWNKDGSPKEWTKEITDMLFKVAEIDPYNPGMNHFTLHAWEGSKTPEKAVPAADRLSGLVPGVSHLQHMPSHIYLLVGRYSDGSEANLGATRAFAAYRKTCEDMGLRTIGGYESHNWDFLWHCSRWEGRGDLALVAANKLASFVTLRESSQRQHALPMYTLIQFARWDEIRATPEPEEKYAYLRFVWHYGQSMAEMAAGDLDATVKSHQLMKDLLVSSEFRKARSRQSARMAEIAINLVTAEIAAVESNYKKAAEALYAAREIEEKLTFRETRTWPHPVQITMGRIFTAAGMLDEAEKALLENLTESPENGWALYALSEVYRKQGKSAEADDCYARFQKAWQNADAGLLVSQK